MSPPAPVLPVITVVVADDDPRVRADFSTLLGLEPDIRVVAVAADGDEAVRAADHLRPDVVVMDVRMPRTDGIDATRQVLSVVGTRTRVLVVTTFDLDEYVLRAVRAGASGFLLKDQAPDGLATAVRTVAAGDAIVSPRATARLLRELVPAPAAAEAGPLTAREVEVVRLVALGLSNTDIAHRAGITRATVKTHVSNVLLKLGLTSRIQIAVWAYQRGVARLDERA